jgi:hypothetical protein
VERPELEIRRTRELDFARQDYGLPLSNHLSA